MKKYQRLAEQIREQIASGVWQPGDRLPSLREQVASSGMSFMTVGHAYQLLESQGRIIARPQSGYYVAPHPVCRSVATAAHVIRDEAVDINTYIFEMLQASRDTSVVPFASAFPDPRLFPLPQLNRSLAQVSKTATAMSVIENLPPGNAELRYAIARRYAQQGITVSPDEIVITAGALEALNLSLQAVTAPGDWVVVENPCFYGALQALERLRLKALSIPTDVKEGIDLMALEQALQEYPVKACWLMTNSQNPLGFTLSAEKKARLVALLTHHNVTLIEDDVYSDPMLWPRETSACQSMGSRRYRVALFVFFQMSGSRFSHWLGCGRKPCQTNSAFAVNEHIIHQFPHAIGVSGLSLDTSI